MSSQLQLVLRASPRTWLVTGAAGFIGSNILETLLQLDQRVVGLDNFSTGCEQNLDEVRPAAGAANWAQARFVEVDIRDLPPCQRFCSGVDLVLPQAALGSGLA